jgi:transposase
MISRLTGLVRLDSLALQQDKRFAMAWNETDREKYAVIRERYASDLSDEEYALIQPLLPEPKPLGRKPTDARLILNALFYMVRCGCPWRYLPTDFPPFTTVQNRFYAWRDSGLWEQIVAVLVMTIREAAGKSAVPSVAIVDSQSVKTTEAGGPAGYDAGKKVKGRKRHIAVDTLGLPIKCHVTPADVQDRDALPDLLKAVSRKSPWIKLAFVDGGYAGDETRRAAFEASRIQVSVVKRSDRAVKGFVVLPKRWIVERTLGWLNRSRRLAKDFETLTESSRAWVMLALGFLLLRRAGRQCQATA